MKLFRRAVVTLVLALTLLISVPGQTQEKISLNPTRPTVSNGSSLQSKGVVQVEAGYDAYPSSKPGEQQTFDTAVYYTPYSRLRLDLTWSSLAQVDVPENRATGIGTMQLGAKVLLVGDLTHRGVPGVGLQYEAELPTADDKALQTYGQQIILLVNHHVGPVNFIANASMVQTGCQTARGCAIGGQQAVALSYRVAKRTSLYTEAFAQNVAQSNSPPGTYIFGGFLHRFSDTFGLDGGLRFGVSDGAARFGTTIGIVYGKRVR